jgi:predicted GNAT family acetyltransferase
MEHRIINNEKENRFELHVGDDIGVTNYAKRGDTIVFTHTEIPPQLEGQGLGKELASAALNYARSEGLNVVPRCRFIAAFIQRYKEYQDLVKSDSPAG